MAKADFFAALYKDIHLFGDQDNRRTHLKTAEVITLVHVKVFVLISDTLSEMAVRMYTRLKRDLHPSDIKRTDKDHIEEFALLCITLDNHPFIFNKQISLLVQVGESYRIKLARNMYSLGDAAVYRDMIPVNITRRKIEGDKTAIS